MVKLRNSVNSDAHGTRVQLQFSILSQKKWVKILKKSDIYLVMVRYCVGTFSGVNYSIFYLFFYQFF